MNKPEFGPDIPPHARRPVAWYAPGVLWQAARKLLAAEQFATHLDRRETFAPELAVVDLRGPDGGSDDAFWFDFVSDTGDGGDATFSVAQALLAPALSGTQAEHEAGGPLPQGRLLILGGDLAYPGSGRLDYQYRFIEPFEQAQAWAATQGTPCWTTQTACNRASTPLQPDEKLLLAIPQNHDWAVSASSFCRYFVSHDRGAVLGARTPQKQTWFAARLPRGWWLLGLDFALEGDIDRTQYESFVALLSQGLTAGQQVILVYPEPYWTRPLGDGAPIGYPKRYQRLEAQLLAAGVHIRLRLAGDLHHYAHDALTLPDGSDTHLVVAGNGGAFTHATHTLDVARPKHFRQAHTTTPSTAPGSASELAQHVEVGLASTPADAALPAFAPAARYPGTAASRAMAFQALFSLFRTRSSGPGRNWRQWWTEQADSNCGLLPVLGLLIALLTWFGWGIQPQIDLSRVPSPSSVLPALAVLAACTAVLFEPLARWRSMALGALHGVAQLGAAWGLTLLCFKLPLWAAWPAFVVGSAAVAGLLLGLALVLACGVFGWASNACFGALASEHHKGFLRFRLDGDGLTVFALGLDRVPAHTEVPRHGPLPKGWRVVDRFRL